jgi:hypothetical protein
MSDLEYWEQRIADTGARIATLLASDAQQFFQDTLRERFIAQGDVADSLSDADLVALKAAASKAAAEAAASVLAGLSPPVWHLASAPEAEADLLSLPAVASTFHAFERRLNDFLGAHGLSDPEPAQWRLPKRFIEGENLVTLARHLFKALGERQVLRGKAAAQQASSTAQARRQRWEEA